jgi:hypothetical protein
MMSESTYVVFLSGKTVNPYRRNHDIKGMLPIPPIEQGLAPPDLFPHKSSVKIPVLSDGVSHQKQTPYPPNLQNCDHEFKAPLVSMAMLSEMGHKWKWAYGSLRVHIQSICAAVVAADNHHFRLGSGATICRFAITK